MLLHRAGSCAPGSGESYQKPWYTYTFGDLDTDHLRYHDVYRIDHSAAICDADAEPHADHDHHQYNHIHTNDYTDAHDHGHTFAFQYSVYPSHLHQDPQLYGDLYQDAYPQQHSTTFADLYARTHQHRYPVND